MIAGVTPAIEPTSELAIERSSSASAPVLLLAALPDAGRRPEQVDMAPPGPVGTAAVPSRPPAPPPSLFLALSCSVELFMAAPPYLITMVRPGKGGGIAVQDHDPSTLKRTFLKQKQAKKKKGSPGWKSTPSPFCAYCSPLNLWRYGSASDRICTRIVLFTSSTWGGARGGSGPADTRTTARLVGWARRGWRLARPAAALKAHLREEVGTDALDAAAWPAHRLASIGAGAIGTCR